MTPGPYERREFRARRLRWDCVCPRLRDVRDDGAVDADFAVEASILISSWRDAELMHCFGGRRPGIYRRRGAQEHKNSVHRAALWIAGVAATRGSHQFVPQCVADFRITRQARLSCTAPLRADTLSMRSLSLG